MCHGLAIIAEKMDDGWKVYAKKGESSHDRLLHELRDDLRYGRSQHLKFEVHFPNRVCDDIVQEIDYPVGWTYIQFGKKIACKEALFAVFKYISENQDMLEFTPNMLTKADLTKADLTGANLTKADLTRANLTGANLTKADLTRANLTGANLTWANLTKANLTKADLTWANLTWANLTEANLTKADLTWANLTKANLTEAKNVPEKYKVK